MEINTLTQLISNMGFPIAVCIYFMFRFEKILKQNTNALQALIRKIK